jgi:hypothetical protein
MARRSANNIESESADSKRAPVKRRKAVDLSKSVEAEVASLRDLTVDELRRPWRTMTGQAAPIRFPRFLVLRMVAYELQARVFGDLDKASIEYLDRIADKLTSPAARSLKGLARAQMAVPPIERRPMKPGSLLVREWKGVLHRVTVLDRGFAWNGEVYDSLSTIARAITGTDWSGPRFFGLRDRKGGAGSSTGDQTSTSHRRVGTGRAGRTEEGSDLRRPEPPPEAEAPSP